MMPIYRRRAIFLFAILTTWGVVVVARLVQKQIVQHDHYVVRAAKQHERTLTLTPVRGSILDARGRILAESVPADSIYADPQAITDPVETARSLAAISELDLRADDLAKRLDRKGEFAWVARQVSPEASKKVAELDLPGIYSLEEHRRTAPKGTLAANVLGFVDIDGRGLAGVELSYDQFVRGKPGKVTLLRDARRGMYLVGGEGANAPVEGRNIVLTIDEVIQFVAERALARAVKDYQATGGVAIVMDPGDGAVLAMASVPTFDPEQARSSQPSAWRNRAVQDLYEPGSTFKIVTAAAALEEGIVTPSQVIDCGPGFIQIANARIREHGGNAYGYLPFEDVMAHSSNVGMIQVALALGQKRFYRYIRAFGFGEQTGVGLPGETVGIVRPPEKWSLLSNATMAIGQEIGVSPLQIARAVCIVANGGRKVEPHIIERVTDRDGRTVYEPPAANPKQVISERTAAVLNEILKRVVTLGTGRGAALDDYVVAGKTGTAQKAVRGGYSLTKYVASFIGYVPADRPRLVILVVVDEPGPSHYGGVVAAPVFREIAEAALHYLQVPPSSPARSIALKAPILAEFSQRPAVADEGASPDRPAAATATNVIPDLRGLDGRTALTLATEAGYRARITGSGLVAAQDPPPGGLATGQRLLTLKLAVGER